MKILYKLGKTLVKFVREHRSNHFLSIGLRIYYKIQNCLRENDNESISRLYLRSRASVNALTDKLHKFVSLEDLLIWTKEFAKTLPRNYDLVVGIPRGGIAVAAIIAYRLGKPLTTPELFLENKVWPRGSLEQKNRYSRILLVDDSAHTGMTINKTLAMFRDLDYDFHITTAAVSVTDEGKKHVDLHYKITNLPFIFEWEMLDAKRGKTIFDIDGVLCENCPGSIDLDEILYTKWIKDAKPYLIPKFEIDAIVSSRLEKYRQATEEWLARHQVQYKDLYLWDIPSKEDRKGGYAQHKIKVVLKVKADIIFESSLWEAKQIWEETKVPTLCIDEMCFFG